MSLPTEKDELIRYRKKMVEGIAERIQKWPKAIGKFVEQRIAVSRWMARQLEESVKTGEVVIFEPDIPPTLSAEFGEERRRRVRTARHEFLKTFEPFKHFSERRLVQEK